MFDRENLLHSPVFYESLDIVHVQNDKDKVDNLSSINVQSKIDVPLRFPHSKFKKQLCGGPCTLIIFYM